MLGGGGGVSHPSQLTTGLVIKSVTTSPILTGERMLFILQVSILSEQMKRELSNRRNVKKEIEILEGEKEIEREEETEKETQTENGKREEKANEKGNKT